VVRGWLLRRRLSLAGPGVLCRAKGVNDEDLFTCESKTRQDPRTYFALEEAGKVYWFDAPSLWSWMMRSLTPVNPYTKTPLSNDTRRRLREWGWKARPVMDATTPEDILIRRWTMLIQIFRENGFTDTHPHQFDTFDTEDLRMMFLFLERDLQIVSPEKDIHRAKLLRLCRHGQRVVEGRRPGSYPLFSAYLLLRMLSLPKDPYVVVFSILSAFLRC
jgi:hypothetical protein